MGTVRHRVSLGLPFALVLFLLLLMRGEGESNDMVVPASIPESQYETALLDSLRPLVAAIGGRAPYCHVDRAIRSVSQGRGRLAIFRVRGEGHPELRSALEGGMEPELVRTAFPHLIVKIHHRDHPLIRHRSRPYERSFEGGPGGETYRLAGEWVRTVRSNEPTSLFISDTNLVGSHTSEGWMHHWSYDSAINSTKIVAVWTECGFRTAPLPERYASAVAHVDCLVDTGTRVILTDYDGTRIDEGVPELADTIYRLMVDAYDIVSYDDYPRTPAEREADERKRPGNVRRLSDYLVHRLDISETPEQLRDSIEWHGLPYWIEEYLDLQGYTHLALDVKRRRRVWGSCSHDAYPLRHLLEIAELSARLKQWDIFVRAHLDVMHDAVARMSYSTAAYEDWDYRIRDLERTGVDVVELSIGMALAAEPVAEGRYWSHPLLLGRAMSVSGEARRFEKEVLLSIDDPALDDVNRMRLFGMYLEYVYSLADPSARRFRIDRLQKNVHRYPAYLHDIIRSLERTTE